MIIEKEYSINDSLQLVDLNQEYINFTAKFDIKAEDPTSNFMMSVIDETFLEEDDKINFNAVVGHIDGDIENNNDTYKNFYIALKSKKPTKVNVKIDIQNNNVENNNDLNTHSINKNNTMEEEPQRTSLNEIFNDEQPQQEPEMEIPIEMEQHQPILKKKRKKKVVPEPEPVYEEPMYEEPVPEPEPEQSLLDKIIEYKYYLFVIAVVGLIYYYIAHVDPSLSESIINMMKSKSPKSSPKSSPVASPIANLIKAPIDTFSEALANLEV